MDNRREGRERQLTGARREMEGQRLELGIWTVGPKAQERWTVGKRGERERGGGM